VWRRLDGRRRKVIAVASVLLIEDEDALTRVLSWYLLDAGHEVAVAASGEAADRKLESYHPEVIVFNTVMEPETKHIWMTRLKELHPGVRILDVSDEKNARARGMIGVSRDGASADASLDLPFPKERLLEAIEGLLPKAQ
jgi:DNA-binding NtrC family response regulator